MGKLSSLDGTGRPRQLEPKAKVSARILWLRERKLCRGVGGGGGGPVSVWGPIIYDRIKNNPKKKPVKASLTVSVTQGHRDGRTDGRTGPLCLPPTRKPHWVRADF